MSPPRAFSVGRKILSRGADPNLRGWLGPDETVGIFNTGHGLEYS